MIPQSGQMFCAVLLTAASLEEASLGVAGMLLIYYSISINMAVTTTIVNELLSESANERRTPFI